jgi:23S rRNA (cytidine1920-2'-O)/16S rRNA (cytidine1409-2'-O)-methyltransferase
VPKQRLDALLAERGLFESRSRAAAAVLAGDVRLGDEGRPAEKPGQLVAEDVPVAVTETPPYVSRGGVKLANALDALGLHPQGRRCLDVGASTGGFTDCLLQ